MPSAVTLKSDVGANVDCGTDAALARQTHRCDTLMSAELQFVPSGHMKRRRTA